MYVKIYVALSLSLQIECPKSKGNFEQLWTNKNRVHMTTSGENHEGDRLNQSDKFMNVRLTQQNEYTSVGFNSI